MRQALDDDPSVGNLQPFSPERMLTRGLSIAHRFREDEGLSILI